MIAISSVVGILLMNVFLRALVIEFISSSIAFFRAASLAMGLAPPCRIVKIDKKVKRDKPLPWPA